MRRTRAHRRSEARLLAELESAFRPGRHATLAGYAWWWRYELGLLAGLTAALVLGVMAVGAVRTVLCGVLAVTTCALWPPWRAAAVAQAWRIITPHRVRSGCVQARIHSRNGRLPAILRTTRMPSGERLRVWCPAGVSAADFLSARAILAAACWAADVRVIGDDRYAHLVTIEVIRRRARPGPQTPPPWAQPPGASPFGTAG